MTGKLQPKVSVIVPHHLPCVKCGYDLNALPVSGACPECGDAVEHSLHGDLLRYADRDWLDHILRSLGWVSLCRRAMMWALIVSLGMLFVGVVVLPRGVDTRVERLMEICLWGLQYAMLAAPGGIAVGLWMTSKPEPREQLEPSRFTVILRALSIAVVPALGVWLSLRVGGPLRFLTGSWVQLVAMVCCAVVWGHAYVLVEQAMRLERRCEQADPIRSNVLMRMRRSVVFAAAFFTIVYWIGPLRITNTGSWAPPSVQSSGQLFFWTVLCWLWQMGVLNNTRTIVRAEAAKSIGHQRLPDDAANQRRLTKAVIE